MAATTVTLDRADLMYPPASPDSAGEVLEVSVEYEIPTTSLDDANDTTNMCWLPANCVPVDCTLYTDDLDSGGTPALVLHVGITGDPELPSGGSSKVDVDAFIASSTVGRAGGRQDANVITMAQFAPVDRPLRVGLTVGTAAATAASGTVVLKLKYRYKQTDE